MKITRAQLRQIIKEELEEMQPEPSLQPGVAEAIQAAEEAEAAASEGDRMRNMMKFIPISMEFMRKYPDTFPTFRVFKQKVNIDRFPKIADAVRTFG